MKRIISFALILLLVLCAAACGNANGESSAPADSGENPLSQIDGAKRILRSLEYENTGRMGDTDGPAFAVYSNIGFSGAAVTLDVAGMDVNTRLSGGRFVNCYAFLGIDVYEGESWANCIDAGICRAGANGSWHLFYNIYEPVNEDTETWYESSKVMIKNDVYNIKLELIDDELARLTIKGTKTNFKDSVDIEIKGALKDGSNTAMLFNAALDYPPEVMLDPDGNPSEDWAQITLANSDKGIRMRDLRASGLKLFRGETSSVWSDNDTDAISIWPDRSVGGFDYSPTEVGVINSDEFYINFDMNRK